MEILTSLFYWFHVVAGIVWIGHLYFFNWVNANFAPTMDAETKKKVVPELMPRALFWFRWGAAVTWITGVLLLMIVFYHGRLALADPTRSFGVPALVMIALVFVAPFIYDALYSSALKEPSVGFWAGVVLAAILLFAYQIVAGFGIRGYAIHVGALMGTIMAYNVWFKIWPAQQKIITATKNGEAPDAALVALAGTRSKHNTYMSVPLVALMLNHHFVWAEGAMGPAILTVLVLLGWATVSHLYDRSKAVKGF